MAMKSLGILLLSALLLTGCAVDSSDQVQSNSDEVILTSELPPNVTSLGVVLASVLIVAGDVEEALVEGLVTIEEVELARLAIKNGEVDLWKQRAEQDKLLSEKEN